MMTAPLWLAACRLSAFALSRQETVQAVQSLPEELSAAELEAINKSVLAKDLGNYFGKGYSCAESMLMVGLRYLKKPEELVWIAAGFGGGMYHKEACGFLTAGIMNLGVASGQLKLERKEAKDWNKQKVNEYWSWWTSRFALRCADIRKEGTGSGVCRRLGLLAAAKVEELILSATKPS
jgi:hypothetical protein